MARIRSLRPNVTREEATEHFSSGLTDILHTTVSGPLKSVADFYVPFQLFQVEIINGGKRDLRLFGQDAVNGSLDLYQFEQLPDGRDVICLETRNCSQPLARRSRSEKNCDHESTATAFQHRFFSRAQFKNFSRTGCGRNLRSLLGRISRPRKSSPLCRDGCGAAQDGRREGEAVAAGLADFHPVRVCVGICLCGSGSEPALSEVEGTRTGGAQHRSSCGISHQDCGPPGRPTGSETRSHTTPTSVPHRLQPDPT